jgi:hypothetical protein
MNIRKKGPIRLQKRLHFAPDFRVNENSFGKASLPRSQDALARVTHFSFGRGAISLQMRDDLIGHTIWRAVWRDGSVIYGEKHLRDFCLALGIRGDLMRGATSREKRGHHIQQKRKTRTFPITDGQRAFGCFDGRGIARELSCRIETAFDGQRLATPSISGERAVRELRHSHIENNVARGTRHAARR